MAPASARFDTFVAGANAAALQHLEQMGAGPTPVFLWGPPGSGKTHLLQAMAHQRHERGERVGWFDPSARPPWTMEPACAVLLLDGCDALRRRAAAQRVRPVRSRRNARRALGGGGAACRRWTWPCAKTCARAWAGARCSGCSCLPEEQARAVLRRESDRRGIFLSDEVMDYLLTRFARDLSHLMALLDRLDGFALAEHRGVTVPLLKKMLLEQA